MWPLCPSGLRAITMCTPHAHCRASAAITMCTPHAHCRASAAIIMQHYNVPQHYNATLHNYIDYLECYFGSKNSNGHFEKTWKNKQILLFYLEATLYFFNGVL